jgi:nucleotide-binding universal stress UspA family protein
MTMIKKILIPLDGSEVAEHALQPALDLAQAAGGEVVLLRCLVGIPLLMPDLAGMYSSMQIEETIEQFRAEAKVTWPRSNSSGRGRASRYKQRSTMVTPPVLL